MLKTRAQSVSQTTDNSYRVSLNFFFPSRRENGEEIGTGWEFGKVLFDGENEAVCVRHASVGSYPSFLSAFWCSRTSYSPAALPRGRWILRRNRLACRTRVSEPVSGGFGPLIGKRLEEAIRVSP